MLGTPSLENVEQARRNYELSRGNATGYNYAEQYAAKLSMIDRREDAVQFLQGEVLIALPRHERAWRDKFNFLLGLIGSRGKGGAGRNALIQLLETGLDPQRQRAGIYYAEFFEPVGSNDEIRELYSKRAASHANFTLALCIKRIGKLAPDPGGLAVWTLPSYGDLAAIARELDDIKEPVRLATAGVYNDIGREIL
jgi:hypothetical protein